PWSHGGTTDLHNGRLLCPSHHRTAHNPHYQTHHHPNGQISFHRTP
ncbi:MAG TPA: HNH endonuclease, partial [Nocardioidaceae bacterium]|nr:HNH endonuclease [Nocardioidaceae bacterium]HYO41487.1 HNH endonuclease [Nocardioidaceae bacterium]